jgi:two-component system, chemotaxis family, protein-glutamate methylesterase/glutaminase
MVSNLHTIAIGASAGGIDALLQIATALPPQFPAIVLVTQHVGTHPSILPELMRARARMHAVHPHDGERPQPGTIYVAPPDQHLLIEDDHLHLSRGPKENHSRPAIDPMMRSAALARGTRAIGVVLTGQLDDGTAGLKAIKRCGGIAIVQDPATAFEPSMPASALANVDVDLSLRIEEIAPALQRIVARAAQPSPHAAPDDILREQQILQKQDMIANLAAIADPSTFTCPDCGGGLWQMKDDKPLRFRCHTGHVFSVQSPAHAQVERTEHVLRSGVRALAETEMLLRRTARLARAKGDHTQAEVHELHADSLRDRVAALIAVVEKRDGSA